MVTALKKQTALAREPARRVRIGNAVSRMALFDAAIRSDRNYFEAGARLTETQTFTLATMPGFEELPAGNVGFLEHWPEPGIALEETLEEIEAHCRAAGSACVRFYADIPPWDVHAQMIGQGYSARDERLYVYEASFHGNTSSRIAMFPVRSEADWQRKLNLQQTSELPSDGHACDPAAWVAFERLKCERSELDFYLFEDESGVVATAAFLPVSPKIVRFKNLFVRTGARRRGVAREVLHLALGHARRKSYSHMVLFGIAGSPGDRLYASARGLKLGQVREYSKVSER